MQFTTIKLGSCNTSSLLSIKQRYKLNAIHNWYSFIPIKKVTVVNKAKIQIECNSQLTPAKESVIDYCCQ